MTCNSPAAQQYGGQGLHTACGATLPYTGLNLTLFIIVAVALFAIGFFTRRAAQRTQ